MTDLELQGKNARQAARVLMCAGTATKDEALSRIADAILEGQDRWLAANELDLTAARENGMGQALLDRLALNAERVEDIARGVRDVVALPDPTATADEVVVRPNGLNIIKRRVPLGVIAMIYEARPNVTVDAAALCLKSGNACILRGGKEAINSNRAVVSIMREALAESGLPEDCVSLVQDTSRSTADELMHLDRYVDVLIPRGGASLIRSVAKNATIPVIRTGEGICHIYVDSDADIAMGANILYNAKCSRPSVCNAVECVLIHEDVAKDFLEAALPRLFGKRVELRCDEAALRLAGDIYQNLGGAGSDLVIPATDEDWDTEYDDYKLAVKIVGGLDEAIDFITEHGTSHSEAIITENYTKAQLFLDRVDAACVYVNASTRFSDGGEFGMGAEIGISTQKLHARGPMGLRDLTSTKYVIYGMGQVRE